MKFPGKRKTKHFFPVSEHGRIPFTPLTDKADNIYIVGIEQPIVDIEVAVEESFLTEHGVKLGQSIVLCDGEVEKFYRHLKNENKIKGEFAGGSIGNTLHNYAVLSDERAILLGAICQNIRVGDYAFKYISSTHSHVNLEYLKPCQGKMGRAICCITPSGERSFVIGRGIMNELSEDYIDTKLIANSSLLLLTAFLLRDNNAPIFKATMKAIQIAKKNNIPIVLSLGTSFIISEQKEFFTNFIKENIDILAGNELELEALTGSNDRLIALERSLEITDFVLQTSGPEGLWIGAHVDVDVARKTKDKIYSKSIEEYNKFEYSRAQLKKDIKNEDQKIYTHINPFMGGPGAVTSTNGAGDAALSALLHDIAANFFHKNREPDSPKHSANFLTYSSIHQIAKYANRVSYEVLKRNSPRLTRGLPEQEDSLQHGYWEK